MTRYVAIIGGRERALEIEEKDGDLFEVRLDGGPARLLDARRMASGTLSLIVDQQSYGVDIEEREGGGDRLNVLVRDSVFSLEVLDERRLRMRQARGGFTVTGKQTVAAPMPGKVIKVLCEEGQTVEEGQGLVVVEAMKMENELRSPKAGKVIEVLVKEGQAVEGSAPLVSVE